jgi:hypothetical protein
MAGRLCLTTDMPCLTGVNESSSTFEATMVFPDTMAY